MSRFGNTPTPSPLTGDQLANPFDLDGRQLINGSIAPDLLRGRVNHIINGGFDIWQRSSGSTSGSGYRTNDRWSDNHSGSSKTHSQQTFTPGQTDVPGEPKYYSRTDVTSVAGAGNYVLKHQPIESVRTLAGQKATLTFYAKADAAKNLAVEFVQDFGGGGTPSATVSGIGVTTFALTTAWQKFTVTVDIPSISGKTLGTTNDGYLSLVFWFDAGSDFNARTNSLGHQSGVFDIANVTLVEGADPVDYAQVARPIGEELALCQRYYFKTYNLGIDPGTVSGSGAFYFEAPSATNNASLNIALPVRMRTTPSMTLFSPDTGNSGVISAGGADIAAHLQPSERNLRIYPQNAVSAGVVLRAHITADAEL